jgi:hypothetical protein
MAAIDFPNAPATNQVFNAPNGVAYIWTGSIWKVYSPVALLPTAAPTYDTTNTKTICDASYTLGDNVMQITQGTQFFSRTFTAQNAANPIEVDCDILFGAGGAAVWTCIGLFIDGAAAAVAMELSTVNTQWGQMSRLRWQGVLAAGPHTFMIRAGGANGQGVYVLGIDAYRIGGGIARNVLTIREVGVGAQGPPGVQGPPGLGNVVLQTAVKQSLVTGAIIGTINSAQLTPFTSSQGAALDNINFTPQSSTSKIEIEATFKGNPNATDCWTLTLFNGSTYVDCQQCFFSGGGSIQQFLPFKTVLPSPGLAAMTINFRVGSNSGNTWRQGQTNDGSTTQNNPNLKSWIVVRELGP